MPARRPKNNTRKTAFVPRGLFMGVLAGTSVIPLCACGGSVQGSGDSGVTYGVAAKGFDGGSHKDAGVFPTVAAIGFDANFPTVADASFSDSVAAFGFDGNLPGVAACCFDGSFSVADVGFRQDAPSVALTGFDGSAPDGEILGVASTGFDGGK